MADATTNTNASLIWAVADLLRGDYRQSEYAKVILPLTVLRRFDCVLKPTKDAALAKYEQLKGKVDNIDPVMESVNRPGFPGGSGVTCLRWSRSKRLRLPSSVEIESRTRSV